MAQQLREVAVNLNVGNLMLLLQFGNMDKPTANIYNTKLFAEQVAPKMRGLFDEWDHRWWPSHDGQRHAGGCAGLDAAVGCGNDRQAGIQPSGRRVGGLIGLTIAFQPVR